MLADRRICVAWLSSPYWEAVELSRLQGLVTSSVNLGTEVGGSGTRSREVAGEYWLDE